MILVNKILQFNDFSLLAASGIDDTYHTPLSGFTQLIQYYKPQKTLRYYNIAKLLNNSLVARRFKRGKEGFPKWYGLLWYRNELSILLNLYIRDIDICHMLYAEDLYANLWKIKKNKKTRIIATYHQPPWKDRELIAHVNGLRRLDAIHIVGENQKEFFSQYVSEDRIFWVGHGVNCKFYVPRFSKTDDKFYCIFVGNWLRDFETMAKIIKKVNSANKNIFFFIVTKKENFSHFHSLKNCELFSGISPEDLKELYQKSHLSVIPLIDATANNSVLESMACGVPIITNDVGGIRGYVRDEFCQLFPCKTVDEIVDAILAQEKHREAIEMMGKKARHWVQDNFSWEIIAEKMMGVYRHVLQEG